MIPILTDEEDVLEEYGTSLTLNITLEDVNVYLLLYHSIVTSVLVSISLLLHLSVFLLLIFKKRLFDRADVFTMAIIFGNFLLLIFHSTTIVVSTIARRWVLGEVFCVLTSNIYLISYDIRFTCILALSIHRFCNVFLPFSYPKHSKKVIVSFAFIIATYIFLTRLWYTWNSVVFFDITWPSCNIQTDPNLVGHPLTSARTAIWLLINLLAICPFVFYVLMCRKACQLGAKTQVVGSFNRNLNNRASTKSNIVDTMKIKLQEEKRKILVLIIVLLYGIPLNFVTISKININRSTFGIRDLNYLLLIHFLFTELLQVVPYIDILILVYFSKEKKEAVIEFLKTLKGRFIRS